jgi:hypothetical protein
VIEKTNLVLFYTVRWSVNKKCTLQLPMTGTNLVCNKYVQFQLSTENSSQRMDYQVRNMLGWSVSHKNFNHILNFNVVIEKTNLVIFCIVHWSVSRKWTWKFFVSAYHYWNSNIIYLTNPRLFTKREMLKYFFIFSADTPYTSISYIQLHRCIFE